MADREKLHDAILTGDLMTAAAITQQAIAEKIDPSELIADTMVPAMAEVGRLFECEEYFVPELLLSARAMKGALELLRPLLSASGAQPAGRVVNGTAEQVAEKANIPRPAPKGAIDFEGVCGIAKAMP